jgi:hypothetical protein
MAFRRFTMCWRRSSKTLRMASTSASRGSVSAPRAAFWEMEVGLDVELSWSFCMALMSSWGPAVQPMRQPVMA